MIEIDLGPLQVAQLAGSQPMPKGEQDHGLVAMRPAIVLAGFDQLLDLTFGEVFPCSDLGILGSGWRDFPFYSGWRYDFQGRFCHMNQCSHCSYFL